MTRHPRGFIPIIGSRTVSERHGFSMIELLIVIVIIGPMTAIFADILGLLTPQFFVIEDNNVNSPFRAGTSGGAFDGPHQP